MIALLLLLLPACGDDPKPGTCDSAERVTWDGFGDGFFATYCRSCHSAALTDRYGAPEGVDFDTEAEVRAQEDRVRARLLDAEDMPPGGGVVPDDLELITRWLDCGP